MTWKPAYSVLSIGIAITCSSPLLAQNSFEVTASANIVGKDLARAKADALQRGFVDATVQLCAQLLPKDIFTLNQELLTRVYSEATKQWIETYKILKNNPSDTAYEVTVNVTPNRKKVRDELIRTGILFDRVKRPVLGPIKISGGAGWGDRMAARFRALGYDVLNRENADIELVGTVSSLPNKTISFEVTPKWVKARNTTDTLIVRASTNDSSDLIASWVATRVFTRVLPSWFRQTGSGRLYHVTLTGMKSYAVFQEVKDLLNGSEPGFSSATERSFTKGAIGLDVIFDGDSSQFTQRLNALKLKSNKLSASRTDESNLIVQVQ